MRGSKAKQFRAISRKTAKVGTQYDPLKAQIIHAMAAGQPIPGKKCLFLGVVKLTEGCARWAYQKLKRGKLLDFYLDQWKQPR